MADAILKLHRLNVRLLKWAAVLAGAATFLIMWVIDLNVFLRKFFNAPLPAGVELTQALLPVAIMLPFGWALASRHHVASAFLTTRLSPRTTRILHAFWMAVGFVVFAAVTWGTWQYALRSYHMGEQAWGATMRFPIWPSKMAVSLGTLLICIQFGLEALKGIIVTDEAPEPEREGNA